MEGSTALAFNNEFATTRERILKLLETVGKPLTADEIASLLGLGASERKRIENDLIHLSLTVKRKSGGSARIEIIPPMCVDCGYTFPARKERFKKPSKCPKCGSHRIRGPWFVLHWRKR